MTFEKRNNRDEDGITNDFILLFYDSDDSVGNTIKLEVEKVDDSKSKVKILYANINSPSVNLRVGNSSNTGNASTDVGTIAVYVSSSYSSIYSSITNYASALNFISGLVTGNTENSDQSTTQQDQQQGQQQMEKEKNKRGKANEQILGTDVKLNGLIMVGGNLKAITGNNNRLWFSGMVVTKGNVGIKGTSKVDFFYDPSLFNISFLQSASIRYRGYEYRIYDTLRR